MAWYAFGSVARYGHLVGGQFTEMERGLADVQLQPGKVLPLRERRSS